jgi:hypothetical protein
MAPMINTRLTLIALPMTIAALAAAGCGSSGSSSGSTSQAAPADATSAATGDIPDNQVFLTFHNSKVGYSISYPEGWTQKGSANEATFSDKGNTVHAAVASGPSATVASVRAALAKQKASEPTLAAQAPTTVSLKHGPAVKATYTVQGPPDPVTGKRPLLVVDRYVYSRGGKVATVDLGTVKGVDNVDAYRLISNSFSWR